MNRKGNSSPIVFSTDPGFRQDEEREAAVETLVPGLQKLIVLLDIKQRAGKSVTLVRNFIGLQDDMEKLGKSLKAFCGCGGSVKDGEIIVQGDNREKISGWLLKQGYKVTQKT